MATSCIKTDKKGVLETKNLLWGPDLQSEVFLRWTQGFTFSEDEPTALVQHDGGPCAIIAPVQAFMLKNLLFCERPIDNLSAITEKELSECLLSALTDIMIQVSTRHYVVLKIEDSDEENQTEPVSANEPGSSNPKRKRMDQEYFHSNLRCNYCESQEAMKSLLKERLPDFRREHGVLLYLYSVILTKGIEQIKNEVEDPEEPLIDGIHGHGSQSLINLLITGRATSNVWDNDKDISGLKLRGIQKQSTIGFLTLMEHLRYCEVGWYLKNPLYPIWIVGSETHLTILFSKDARLVTPENEKGNARQIFQSFDPEGNGFIETPSLGDLMAALNLVSEKEYVDIMKTKLDAENLGIITYNSFMEEFYPGETTQDTPCTFRLYHYNGLARSCRDGKISYTEGKCVLKDELEVQLITDTSQIKFCLQTKWPTIEVEWKNGHIPSII